MPTKHPMRDVIVLLPGILGSVLQRDGKDVWAPSPGAAMRALWTLGRSITSLQLDGDDWTKDDLGDGVTADRLVSGVHVLPGFWEIDVYSGIRKMILDSFDVVPGTTYVELAYDWRRDNRVAARRLQRVAMEKLAVVRQDNPDAKLILIGHSMGGLVSRYFLECMDGWKDTRMLVTFGTPYRGSLNALDFVANGFVKKVGPLKVADLSTLLLTLTSVYQLLPIYPCLDLGAGYVRVAETAPGDVPNLDLARAGSALHDFHRAIEAGVAAHDPRAYEIHTVVGITQPTNQSARKDGNRILVEKTYKGADQGGDGTVPRASATPIETDAWADFRSMYSSEKHGSLQGAEAVQTQLLGILTETDFSAYKAAQGVAVEVDPVFALDEPVVLRALPMVPNLELVATVTNLGTAAPVGGSVPLSRDADEVHHLEMAPLPPGDYRLRVEGTGSSEQLVDPVHSLFSVAEPEG